MPLKWRALPTPGGEGLVQRSCRTVPTLKPCFFCQALVLQPSERGAKAFAGTVLLNIRQAKDHWTLWLPGPKVDDRDAAEALQGAPRVCAALQLSIDRYGRVLLGGSDRPAGGQPEGCAGQVRELMSTGPQTVLVLAYEQDGKHRNG